MNNVTYYNFLINNKKMINNFSNSCQKNVIKNCDEFNNKEHTLYHGTTPENAQKIREKGFVIDRFYGTQPMGIGIYTAFDRETAQEFGDCTVSLNVYLNSIIRMTNEALNQLTKIQKSYIEKIKRELSSNSNEYFEKSELEENISKQLGDVCSFLAEKEGVPVFEKAKDMVFQKESSIILSNLLDDELTQRSPKSAILSSTLGIYMYPIQQLVIRNPDEIKTIE